MGALVRTSVCLGVAAALCGCSDLRIVENSPTTVTVRYDGLIRTADDAAAVARDACAARGKTARLRKTEMRAVSRRFAHFDCVDA